jgi:hypothetical protein
MSQLLLRRSNAIHGVVMEVAKAILGIVAIGPYAFALLCITYLKTRSREMVDAPHFEHPREMPPDRREWWLNTDLAPTTNQTLRCRYLFEHGCRLVNRSGSRNLHPVHSGVSGHPVRSFGDSKEV